MKHISINQKIIIRSILNKHGCTNIVFKKALAKLNNSSECIAKQARRQISGLVSRCTGLPISFALAHPYSKYARPSYSTRAFNEPRHKF